MSTFRTARRTVLIAGIAAGALCTAPTAGADDPKPQLIAMQFANGNCASTAGVTLPAGVPTTFDIITSANLSLNSRLLIPSKNIDMQLPDTWYWTVNSVDLGSNPPGPLEFEIRATPWSGSAGAGCKQAIMFE